MPSQESFHPGFHEEAQEDPARVTEDANEGHQRPLCSTNLQISEVPLVDLGLLARKRTQTQISLRLRPGPVACNHMAEVVGVTTIATFVDHTV